jgi:hypothetical protein
LLYFVTRKLSVITVRFRAASSKDAVLPITIDEQDNSVLVYCFPLLVMTDERFILVVHGVARWLETALGGAS